MDDDASPLRALRAFGGRFAIALVVGSLLMAGVVSGVNREVAKKIDSIPQVDLRTSPLPPAGANYLIVGSDTRDFVSSELEREAFGEEATTEGKRSDTIMVMHVEPEAERTLVVSFPRDLWVNIPGHGYSKINAAYNYGPQTLIDTLRSNFGIDIHHYVELNFISFVGLVDELGNVGVYVPYAAKDDYTGFDVPAGGCWQLDGEKSLQWVRSRYLQYRDERTGRYVSADIVPDIGRIGRQQDFMRRLAGLAVQRSLSNPFVANHVADKIIDNLQVDDGLDKQAIFDLLDAFRTLNTDDTSALDFQTMPWKDGGIQGGGQQVLLARMDLAGPLITRLNTFDQRPRPTPAPATVRVRVINGSGKANLGEAVTHELARLGFVTVEPIEHTVLPLDQSEVAYGPGQVDKGKLLLRYIEPQARFHDGAGVGVDVDILLGRDFENIAVPADAFDSTTTTIEAAPDAVLEAPLALPPPPAAVVLPNPAPRGAC